ncbi:MAG: hypothetical protein M3282_02930 [Gemmatimonadota bacterium]|nr:hypothetical protein [Gemmatimonadota bacterium]
MTTRIIGLLALGVCLAGCYTLKLSRDRVPDVGTRVAFDLNDTGRVALGGTMGPAIAQIEGRLISKENGEYAVAVSSIRLLGGGQQVWRGEQVRIKPEHVSSVYERRFSTGRSVALGVSVVGSFAAYLATRALATSGGDDPGGGPSDTVTTQRGRP